MEHPEYINDRLILLACKYGSSASEWLHYLYTIKPQFLLVFFLLMHKHNQLFHHITSRSFSFKKPQKILITQQKKKLTQLFE